MDTSNSLSLWKYRFDDALLPVPWYLEDIDIYVHQGILPDLLYRKPWTCDRFGNNTKVCSKKATMRDNFNDLCFHYQQLMSHRLTRSSNPALSIETIPSSNQGSQESLDSYTLVMLQTSFDSAPSDNGQITIEKYSKDEMKDDQDIESLILEVPSIQSNCYKLHYILIELTKTISLWALKCVQDPFLTKDGVSISEKLVLSNSYPSVTPNNDESSNVTEEQFKKMTLMDYTIEEILSKDCFQGQTGLMYRPLNNAYLSVGPEHSLDIAFKDDESSSKVIEELLGNYKEKHVHLPSSYKSNAPEMSLSDVKYNKLMSQLPVDFLLEVPIFHPNDILQKGVDMLRNIYKHA